MILETIFKSEHHFGQYFHHFTVVKVSIKNHIHTFDKKWHFMHACRSNLVTITYKPHIFIIIVHVTGKTGP